ncbi:MAG: YdeI/OmpD-associated family protein [Deltaproteobacteria bacterium]|nr:YdeI/OmpD-associated family protein [Deltaproteobacteria bacterium]
MPSKPNQKYLAFKTPEAWAAWLQEHHASSTGLWIKFFKKGSGVATVTYDQALDEALCWGWIDGQLKPFDDTAFLRRFTPRGPRSGWAKRNRDHVERLTREGRMKPSGLAQVEAAKADGRWDAAYDSPSASEVPADFLAALAKHKKAEAFFNTLNKANRYAISYRLQTAKKPETRARRFEQLLQMMKDGKRLH